jgi:phage tail sheath gpL-like
MQQILKRVQARLASSSFGGSAWRLAWIPGVLGTLAVVMALASCGKSAQTIGPDVGATASDGAEQSAGQPSSKFAFSTSELALIPSTTGTSGWVTILSSPIKMPAAKELFVSASLEAGLFTQTLVRSKNNKKDTSTASVAIQVQALIDNTPMPPGTVTYAARTQTLSATLEGAIGACLTTVTNADGTTSIIVDQDCVTPEEIELILTTLSAASFNFVASNVPVGTHVMSIQARISSSTSSQEGSASASALVGKGTVIAQTVRAVK